MKRLVLLAAVLLGGCSPDYGGLAIEAEGTLLSGTTVSSRRLNIVLGHALRVHARPRSLTSQVYEDASRVELVSAEDSIVRVYRDQEDWRWVFVGRGVGTTCIEVLIDGSVEECVEVVVSGAR
ncbi:MAG: hypothetical protein AAGA54_14340 [Myxococcota bacterium]